MYILQKEFYTSIRQCILYYGVFQANRVGFACVLSKSLDIRRKGALSCRFWLWSVPRVNAENIYKISNTTKKHPRLPVCCSGCRGRRLRYIFLLNRGSALEAHLDAVVPHDDGLDQRLHDAAVPVVGGVAFLHVLPEVCQPHPHCGIPGVRCLESLLPGLQRSELLAVVVYLRVVVPKRKTLQPLKLQGFPLAAGEGFEPSHTESESAVLPLHNPAVLQTQGLLYPISGECQAESAGFL